MQNYWRYKMKKLEEKIAIHREDGECGCKYSEEEYSCVQEAEAFNDGMKAYRDFLPDEAELHEIFYNSSELQITIAMTKGLKAIFRRIKGTNNE